MRAANVTRHEGASARLVPPVTHEDRKHLGVCRVRVGQANGLLPNCRSSKPTQHTPSNTDASMAPFRVLQIVDDSPGSEYAFKWTRDHILQPRGAFCPAALSITSRPIMLQRHTKTAMETLP